MGGKKTSWPRWIAAVLLLAPVLYVTSFRVVLELARWKYLRSNDALLTYYGSQAHWCDEHAPQPVRSILVIVAGGEPQWNAFVDRYVLWKAIRGRDQIWEARPE